MARKLKTYQTSLGFYDQAIATPSMKAALEAWGADSNLFHQGVAKETDDPEIVDATMAKPGVVLKRPVGSNGPFKEHAELPTELTGDEAKAGRVRRRSKSKGRASAKISDKQARKAALEFEREQKRRDAERRKEDAERAKERERREEAVAKAQAALNKAQREHEEKADAIEAERASVDERAKAEENPLGKAEGKA